MKKWQNNLFPDASSRCLFRLLVVCFHGNSGDMKVNLAEMGIVASLHEFFVFTLK